MDGSGAGRRRLVRDLSVLAVVAVMLVAAFVAGGAALYREFYSPSAFVLRYLSLLEEGRAADALAVPGVQLDSAQLEAAGLPGSPSEALLRAAALSDLEDAVVTAEEVAGDVTEVTVAYRAGGHEGRTTFRVGQDGTAGILPVWRFAQSPLAVVELTVDGSMAFQVNGFPLDKRQVSEAGTETDPAAAVPLLVFSPGLYSVTVDTAMAESSGVAVLADAPQRSVPVDVSAQPTEEFRTLVQQRVEEFLAACTTQQVLQPTGCPFGYVVNNRVEDLPVWSIAQEPQISLVPEGAGWRIPDTEAVAHIEVGVRSLFDGSYRLVSEDVPFLVNATIDVLSDGSASIRIGGTPAQD